MNAFNEGLESSIKLIKNLFAKDRKVNVQDFLTEANKHKPSGTRYTDGSGNSYRDEMSTRDCYRQGRMRPNMIDVLKRRFKKTHSVVEKEQINLRIVQREIKDKAQVFRGTGEFYLVDDKGERQDNDQFDDMMSDGLVILALKEMDAICRSQHRCMVMPWWDDELGHLMTSAWVPYLVHIVPSLKIKERGNVDMARVVGFEHYGVDGPRDSKRRYEFWGKLPEKMAKKVGRETIHFVSDGQHDYPVNDEDIIPYINPDIDGERPIYPFVFFRDSADRDLFIIGEEDMLTINQQVNSGITDLGWAVHAKANGKWVHTKAPGGNEFGYESMEAGAVVDIEAGATLEDVAANIPIEGVMDFWTRLIDYDGVLQGQGKSALAQEGIDSATGISLKIRDKDKTEDRQDMTQIYHEPVLTLLRRCQIVHNHNCKKEDEIPFEFWPMWAPGEPDVPIDAGEENDNAAKEQAMNVSDPADLRMKRFKEDRVTAEKAVKKRAEFRKELNTLSTAKPLVETAADEMARLAKENEEPPEDNPSDGEDDKNKPPPLPLKTEKKKPKPKE